MRWIPALLWTLVVASPLVADAQQVPSPVAVGSRVRVWTAGEDRRQEGMVVRLDDAMLVLASVPDRRGQRPADIGSLSPDSVPVASITRLDVQRPATGGEKARSAILRGLGLGLLGAAAGTVIGAESDHDGDNFGGGFGGFLVGGSLGLTLGVTSGLMATTRWQRVPLPSSSAP